MTDIKDWIKRARQGDGEAFTALIRAHEQSLYKIARSFFTDPMDAEDAVAQTVLDCWEKLDSLKKPAYFKTWLTRILINNCRDLLRAGARIVPLDEMPERPGAEDEHSGLYFEALLACLPEIYRPVMTLYYGEGFRAREIAELLDIPVGTVTARLKRGREQLQEKLRKGEILL
ncbi:MAG: sigma-70 family RNA polymerase sigma factor [Oscillospiraceae bacterium]|nr:sigma-70 family RNA polymerase sigma factor [Oscillospiraceae bacterium]